MTGKRIGEMPKQYYFKALILALIALSAIFLFGNSIRFILVVTALITAASLSTFYHNYFKSPINFELIKLSTVLSSAAYGLPTGLAVGIISTIASKVISEKLDQTAIVSLVGIAIVAVAAAMFPNADIALLGLLLVGVYHAITAPIQMAMGGTWAYGAVYVGSNVLFNIAIFTRIAPVIYRIM